jgi:hypothetical protein
MLLFPLFLFVFIINLLWLTQFVAEIRSESTVVGLNVAMVLSWLVFVFLYWNLRIKKSMSSVYEVLVDTKDTTVSVDENKVEPTKVTEMSEMKDDNGQINTQQEIKHINMVGVAVV